jgi:hypothetical protein
MLWVTDTRRMLAAAATLRMRLCGLIRQVAAGVPGACGILAHLR